PLANLEPRTLVWKLAAIVAAASAGENDRESHEIAATELAEISEQFAEQLHFLLLPPENYRAQEHEPVLGGSERSLLILAHSWRGKTAWVAESASHTDRPLVYFDVGGLPDASVPASFLRELLAQLSSRMSIDKSRTLRAGSAALEGLRGVNEIIVVGK